MEGHLDPAEKDDHNRFKTRFDALYALGKDATLGVNANRRCATLGKEAPASQPRKQKSSAPLPFSTSPKRGGAKQAEA